MDSGSVFTILWLERHGYLSDYNSSKHKNMISYCTKIVKQVFSELTISIHAALKYTTANTKLLYTWA